MNPALLVGPYTSGVKTAGRSERRFIVLIALAVLLALAFLTHLGMGGTWLTPADVLRVLFHGDPSSRDYAVVWDIRLPRALGCILVGAMLSAVGSAFQALFRNPIADPYTVGVSSGAAAGGALAWVLNLTGLWGGLGMMGLGFIGGFGALAVVFALSKRRGVVDVKTLLLSGVVVGSLLSAITSFILFMAGQDTNKILKWLLGSMSPMFMDRVYVMAVTAAIGTTILLLQTRHLNPYAIGEATAKSLGVDTERLKTIVLVAGTAMTAVCVGAVGIVGFLGLVSPHIGRRLLGVDWRVSMPAAILIGPTLLLFADILAQRALPDTELPVGVVTAIIGAPFLLVLLKRDTVTQ